MRTHHLPTLLMLASLSAVAVTGCHGHGQYTKDAMSKAQQRNAELKSANEYQQAHQAYLAGDLDKAHKFIDNAITINPSVAQSHVLRGRILLEQSDLEESANSLLRAETLDPKNVEAQYYLGIVYERFSQPEKALERYKNAAALEPSNPQYAVAAAETMIDSGHLEDADDFLTSRYAEFEHNAGVRQTLGHIAMLKGDNEKACTLFDEARLLAPDDTEVLEDLLRAQIATGKFAEAEYNIDRLLKVPANNDRRDLRQLRARCLLNLDRPVEARQALIELTSDDAGQKDIEAWILLGSTSYLLHDMNHLRMAATRSIALDSKRPEGFVLRALWQRKNGDLASALTTAQKAVDLRGSEIEPLLLQGVILRELRRYSEARTAFQTAASEDPSNHEAQQALATVPTDESTDH